MMNEERREIDYSEFTSQFQTLSCLKLLDGALVINCEQKLKLVLKSL